MRSLSAAFVHGIETSATVISKRETIAPNAGDFAKVDLVLEVRLPRQSTCSNFNLLVGEAGMHSTR